MTEPRWGHCVGCYDDAMVLPHKGLMFCEFCTELRNRQAELTRQFRCRTSETTEKRQEKQQAVLHALEAIITLLRTSETTETRR